ncbi:UTP:GlnB uridylyltransferase [Rothia mucilaginosa DY-18]|uniref:UTP:GlnB uridylyltransferase n=1 Tax=Rothia mucilaginosa (strain DY-18) TaxID=680646 RepID=D2NTW2_ROTMD|nr:UTP:GlnB uridylyltransferase [Rothia mucilaginosa DY-18]
MSCSPHYTSCSLLRSNFGGGVCTKNFLRPHSSAESCILCGHRKIPRTSQKRNSGDSSISYMLLGRQFSQFGSVVSLGDVIHVQTLTEDPVGPCLVDEDDRQTKTGHEGHNAQGVLGAGCVRNGERVCRVQGGGQNVRVHCGEDCQRAECDEYGQTCESATLTATLCGDPSNQNSNHSQDGAQPGDAVTGGEVQCQNPCNDRQQQDGSPAYQDVAGTVADVTVGLQSDEGKTLNQGEANKAQTAEQNRQGDPCEGAANAIAVLVDGQTHGGQTQQSTDEQCDEEGRNRQSDVPVTDPLLVVLLTAVFNGDHAQNQEDQREGQGDVQSREEGCVPDGECSEQSCTAGHKPHLVTVPDGADGVQQQTTFLLVLSELGTHQHTDTQVETIQDQVHDEEDTNGCKPEGGQARLTGKDIEIKVHGESILTRLVGELQHIALGLVVGLVLVVRLNQLGHCCHHTGLDVLDEQVNLNHHQHTVEQTQGEQGEEDFFTGNTRGDSCCSEQVNRGVTLKVRSHNEGLAAHFGEDPAEGDSEEGSQDGPDCNVLEQLGLGDGAHALLTGYPQRVEIEGQYDRTQTNHAAEAPVGDLEGGQVINLLTCTLTVERVVGQVGAELSFVLGQQGLNTLHRGIEVVMCQEGQHAGDLDDGVDLIAALSAEFTDGQNGEGGAIVARGFCSSHLHGLLVDHHLCLQVTGRADTCEGEETHNSAQAQGLEPDLVVSLVTCALVGLTNNNLAVNDLVDTILAATPQLVPCDTNQEATSNLDCGGDDVRDGHPCEGVHQHCADVGHTGTTVNHLRTNGVLHPGVCNQNEECRNPGAENCHEQRECVYSRLETVPTEDPQTKEG